MAFKTVSPKNWPELAFLTQNKAKLCQRLIKTLFFLEKRQFFPKKLSKISQSCDHDIDPSLKNIYFRGKIGQIWRF
jgi:hypothetical protein